MFDEEMRLLITELHDGHTFGYLWVEDEMESDGAWELYDKHSESVGDVWGIFTTVIGDDGKTHA